MTVLLAAALSMVGFGHSDGMALADAFAAAFKAVRQSPSVGAKSPVGTTPFPPLTGRPGNLPKPEPGHEDDRRVHVIHADVQRAGDHVTFSNGVELTTQGYHVFAEEGEGNVETRQYEFRGHVTVFGVDGLVWGDRVSVNFRDRSFVADQGSIEVAPPATQGFLRDPLYVKAMRAGGVQTKIDAMMADFTTCDYPKPHFDIIARTVTVQPGHRAVLRHATLYVLRKRIVDVPYLVVPLDDPRNHALPTVGRSKLEGYFVKYRFGMGLSREVNALYGRIDYFSKLGNGIGGDYRYGFRQGNQLLVYAIPAAVGMFEIQSHHTQTLKHLSIQLDNTYDRNNYLVSRNSTNENNRVRFAYAGKTGSTTSLTLNRTAYRTTGFDSTNLTTGLTHTGMWSKRLRSSLSLNLSDSRSVFSTQNPVERKQLDVNVRMTNDEPKATTDFLLQKSVPVGHIDNFYSPNDVTPSLTLSTSSKKLFSKPIYAPFDFRMGLGSFKNASTKVTVTRSMLDFSANRTDPGKNSFKINWNGKFRQAFYSDGAAQFVGSFNGSAERDWGKAATFSINYNYLRPQGFTPLSQDSSGSTNQLMANLSRQVSKGLSLGAQSGYDFLSYTGKLTPWQVASLRADFTPNEATALRTLATYDPGQRAWSNIRFDLSLKRSPTFLAVGARYDGLRHTWAAINLYATALRFKRLSADVRAAYNGFTKKLETQDYALIYDLHCAEAVVQISDSTYGYNSGRQISFYLRLKALPFDNLFGTGRQGQPFGTGTGR